jgi:hypothetical protein
MWDVYNFGIPKLHAAQYGCGERVGGSQVSRRVVSRRVGVVEKWYARQRDDPPGLRVERSFPECRAALAFPYQECPFTWSTEEQIAARFFAMGWISECTGTSSTPRVAARTVRFTHTS